jgi:hypothetical protein
MKRFSILTLMILVVSISACGPSQMLSPTFTVTPINTKTPTKMPTPTPTLTPTQTNTPTPTFTPTLIPGPELITYLPKITDIPQCSWVEYSVDLDSSWLWCSLPGNINFNVSISTQEKPYTQSDLNSYTPVPTVTLPTIGQGAVLSDVSNNGKDIFLVFYKGNTMVQVENSNPNGKANVDSVVKLAQQVDKLIPDQIVPPLVLSFPDQLNQDVFRKYFYRLDISIVSNGSMKKQADYTENSSICIDSSPMAISHDLYTVGLYDAQKQAIVSKDYYEMLNRTNCGTTGPRYGRGEYKVGDKYEIRVAVGDTLVDVFPFETK